MNINVNMNENYADDMMDLKNPILCYDDIFWKVFGDLDNVIIKMFCDITDIDYLKLKNNTFLLRNEEEINEDDINIKKYQYVLRFIDSHIIRLELNKKSITWNIYNEVFDAFKLFKKNSYKKICNPCYELLQVNLNVYKDRAYPVSDPIEYNAVISKSNYRLFIETSPMYNVCCAKCYDEYIKNDNIDNLSNAVKWGALIWCVENDDVNKLLSSLEIDENDKEIILDRFSKIDKGSFKVTKGEIEDLREKYKTEYIFDNIICKNDDDNNDNNDDNDK